MKQKISAPLSALIATLVSVGRLALTKEKFSLGEISYEGDRIIEFIFSIDRGIDSDHSLQLMFGTFVLWLIVFSILWFILSLISKDSIHSV